MTSKKKGNVTLAIPEDALREIVEGFVEEALENGAGEKVIARIANRLLRSPSHHRLGLPPEHGDGPRGRKLTDKDAFEIRTRYNRGGETYASLADDYDVSENVTRCIITGQTYKDAGGPVKA